MKMPGNILLLLSIKPEYAAKIFTGQKTVELRRVRTRLNTGDLVLVYVSSPQKALVGTFEVESIQETEITELPKDLNKFWKQIKNYAGISPKEFQTYYQGATVVVGIFFTNVKIFEVPIHLDQLRQKIPQLKPPQSYRYVNENEMKIINSLIAKNNQLQMIKK
ncbi:MAG TPA: ASCH domain-containing protein [Nodularia sp. (in: cyanobacteria)]|nr:ASCH domain-containing protein [Nodularia sp. (in: cyanobacteria)]